MTNVSSILTLALRIFLPTFFVVFYGLLMVVSLFSNEDYVASIPMSYFRIFSITMFFATLIIIYLTVFKLRRVELDENSVFVSDYFKQAKYPLHNVELIEENNYLLFKTVSMQLAQSGIFGKRITFMPSGRRWPKYKTRHPEIQNLIAK